MTEVAKCPYCNQPLGSSAAIRHLHEAEARVRRDLIAEANADVKRKVAEARASAEQKVRAELEREKSKRERGLERTIDQLQHQNRDMERRLDALSAPDRGDMNEADIAEELTHAFPDDEITRMGKGGDILQLVRYPSDGKAEQAGVILYECKDTKRWSNAFVSQIKTDGQAHRTPYLVLVSRVLPAKEEGACVRDGVVIADPLHVRHLAWIVRHEVIATHRAELAGQDRAGKTARLYEYLRSDEFREQLSAVVHAGTQLTEMLLNERKGHEREWSRRQYSYDELLRNSVGIEEAIRHIVEIEGPATHQHARTRRSPPRRGVLR